MTAPGRTDHQWSGPDKGYDKSRASASKGSALRTRMVKTQEVPG